MSDNTPFNARLPKLTHDQINELADEYGLTKTQVLILAINQLHRYLLPNDRYMAQLTDDEKALIQPTD